ncbi:helix-turn-helix domain-containing protein [Anaerotruncus colihominis]|uniref:winged helix-turn-helix domain-containing protein n=2 Tax=Eubacteriales TaxID=186802 RepID=UPI002942F98B|nr:helix-turn-helix domain-containing protein [Anaerotruncus colihominis]
MAWKCGKELELTSTEYRILRLLLAHPGQVFSAQNIYESIWEEPFHSGDSNSIMVFIRRLRSKIEDDPHHPVHLVTVWGKGYRIE